MMIYIFLNILDGILFLMRLSIMKMKLKKYNGKKIAKLSKSSVEWIDEESFFLNYQNGKNLYLNIIKKIQISFILNQEKMK